jgi:FkbM family methyltransferase
MVKRTASKRLRLAHHIAELFDTRLPYFKGARQLRNVFTQMLAPAIEPPQRISTRYGFDMLITSAHDAIDYQLYTRGIYEAGPLYIIHHCLNEGDVFVDVGANIGLMSLLAGTQVGETGAVYAFEPVADTFTLLQNNIALNRMNNIYALNSGLGSAQEVKTIYSSRHDNRGMASFIQKNSGVADQTEVQILTLDVFLAEQGVDAVRMMKIDVEGWELEVLKGAQGLLKSPGAPMLCVEYNTQLPEYKAVYDFITTINSYQVYALPHGNWHVSRLLEIKSVDSLPAVGSINIYCFLPFHLQSIPARLFVQK